MAEKKNVPTEHKELYANMKDVFADMWRIKIKELCNIGSMRNYSSDNPLSILQGSDIKNFLLPEMSFFNDPNSDPEKLAAFLDAERDTIKTIISEYAEYINKPEDELTFAEIKYCLGIAVEDYLYRKLEEHMKEQNIAEIVKIVRENATAEDFDNTVMENHDKIDFERKWHHTRTKVGTSLSLEDLTASGIEIEDTASSGDSDKMLQAFVESLEDRQDRDLVEYLLRGYTQEKIARCLNLTSQGAVSKRINKLREKFEDFKEQYI